MKLPRRVVLRLAAGAAALTAFARSLWEAFPDLSFELVRAAETEAGTVAAE